LRNTPRQDSIFIQAKFLNEYFGSLLLSTRIRKNRGARIAQQRSGLVCALSGNAFWVDGKSVAVFRGQDVEMMQISM